MKKTDFDGLVAGLEGALSYAKGQPTPGTRETAVEVDRTFVAAAQLEAGPTQQEFAGVTGNLRILAREPPAIAEAGLAKGARKRRGKQGD
jgi:hypothetical protein